MDLAGFTSSPQGQQALQQLGAHGFAGGQAQAMLEAAVPAAAQALRSAARGDRTLPSFTDSNYVMNFTAAAVSGLIRGQGFMGSAMDGMQGMVGGYIAQVIAARFGLPKRTAGIVGAVITPMAIDFIWAKLEGSPAQPQQPGLPGGAPALPAAPGYPQAPGYPPAAGYPQQGGYPQYASAPRGYGYAVAPQGYAVPAPHPGQGYYAQQRYQHGAAPGYAAPTYSAPAFTAKPGYVHGQGR